MKISLYVFGSLLALIGLIWFLQGINILPGSFMTGQPEWVVNGAITFAVGMVMVFFARTRG